MDNMLRLAERTMPTDKVGRLKLLINIRHGRDADRKVDGRTDLEYLTVSYMKDQMELLIDIGYFIHTNNNDYHINPICLHNTSSDDTTLARNKGINVADVVRRKKITKLLGNIKETK